MLELWGMRVTASLSLFSDPFWPGVIEIELLDHSTVRKQITDV